MELPNNENDNLGNLAFIKDLSANQVDSESLNSSNTKSAGVSHAVADLDKVQATAKVSRIKQEDVSHMCEQVQKTFEKKLAHWTERVEALERLHDLADKGAAVHDEFLYALNKLKDPLLAQLKELRSAIVREACSTVSAIAYDYQQLASSKNHSAFISLSVSMVEVLLKQAVVTIKVISQSAQNCIKNIVKSASPHGSHQLLSRLIKGCNDKHSVTRKICIDYIRDALNNWNDVALQKKFDELTEAIARALDDADDNVRRNARDCFWSFEKRFQEESEELMSHLDNATKRRLIGAKGLPAMKKPSRSKKMSLPGRITASINTEVETKSPRRKQHLSLRRPVRIQYKTLHSTTRQQDFADLGSQSANNPQLTSSRNLVNGAQRVLNTPAKVVQQASVNSFSNLGNAMRIGNQNPLQSRRQSIHKQPPRNRFQHQHHESDTYNVHASKVAEAKNRFEDHNESYHGEESFDIKALLNEAQNSLWSNRVEAFSKLYEHFAPLKTTHKLLQLSKALLSRLGDLFIDRVSDAHYRVIQVAYPFFALIIEDIAEEVEQHMERALPHILTKLSDPKVQIRKVSNELLESCFRSFSHDNLCSLLVGLCTKKGDKLRLGCLECLVTLIPTTKAYFHHSHLRQLVTRIVSYLSSRKNVIKAATIKLFLILYQFNESSFLQIVKFEVSSEDRARITKVLTDRIPDLNRKLEKIELTHDAIVMHGLKESEKKCEIATKSALEEAVDCDDEKNIETETHLSIDGTSTKTKKEVDIQENIAKTEEKLGNQENTMKSQAESSILTVLSDLAIENIERKMKAIKQVELWIKRATFEHSFWEEWGEKTTLALMHLLNHDNPILEEMVLSTLCTMFSNNMRFLKSPEVLFHQLIEYSRGKDNHLAYGANRTLLLLVQHAEPSKFFELAVQTIVNEEVETLLQGLKVLLILIPRTSPKKLLDSAPTFVPALCEAFSDRNPSIRKCVMLNFVKLYGCIGEDFGPFMNGLDKAQRKLVQIYIDKEKKE